MRWHSRPPREAAGGGGLGYLEAGVKGVLPGLDFPLLLLA